jgi:ribosomal protein S18 acetylase RimI-like enzyme
MQVITRSYTQEDRLAVRAIYGTDEFARPKLLARYPGFSEYLADEMSYYPDYEPESLFVAEVDGHVVGALLGAVDTGRFEDVYRKRIRPLLVRRFFTGTYGKPGWVIAILRTEWVNRGVKPGLVDRNLYPAHLHIGILPAYRRRGLGTKLMAKYGEYLHSRGIPGYHLFASSFHPLGIAFYQKLSLKMLGRFDWRLHTGFKWMTVIESVFAYSI